MFFQRKRKGQFEVYKDVVGQYRLRLRASNGRIIATGEAYKNLEDCYNGIESIKFNSKTKKIIKCFRD